MVEIKEFITNQIKESINIKQEIMRSDKYIDTIIEVSMQIIDAYKSDNKLLICGNGGSAADAQHITAELVSKFRLERKGLAAISLTTNSSIITAVSNDYGYNKSFERQVEALGKTGDVFIGISTSGNSKNIVEAFKKAKECNMKTIGLLGNNGGKCKKYADVSIIIPSDDVPRIQECHIMIGHIICEIIEINLFGNKNEE